MEIFIRNMVCDRCINAVKNIFENAKLVPLDIKLGTVTLAQNELSEADLNHLDQKLKENDFEIVDDKRKKIIVRLKSIVIDKIHHHQFIDRRFNWSTVLAEELKMDYNYLSTLFSSIEGVTIEHFIISQKIEKAKELLFYDELSLSEISDKLGYSSVQHLSAQFKTITGATPSAYKKLRSTPGIRKGLDKI